MSSHGGSRPASVSYVGSNATVTSEMSMAYRNRKVVKRLNAWYYGSGKFPFKVAIILFVVGFLILFGGIILISLTVGDQRQLDIGNWWGEILSAGLIVGGLLVIALGFKFLFIARRKSTEDRKKLAFRPKGLTKVSVVNNAYEVDKDSTYKQKSGTSSIKAVNSPYQSTIGTQSRHSASIARTGDSLPSLDNRPISPSYSSQPQGPARPQGRYQQNPERRDDRDRRDDRPPRYDDRGPRNDDRDRRRDDRDRRPDDRDRRPDDRDRRPDDRDRRPDDRDRRPDERDRRPDDRDRRPDDRDRRPDDHDRRPDDRDRRPDDRDRRPDDRRSEDRGSRGSRQASRSSRDFDDIPLDNGTDHRHI